MEVEYATIEAAEIAQTLEKDRRMLVFGEDRLLFLADAVFAIAMTLLVLEITLPVGEHIADEGHFNEALGTLIAQTLSYLITFAVLARYWIAHRSLMRLVDRLDTPAIWLTFLFLVFVAFFPVPSGILGDYDYHRRGRVLYAGAGGLRLFAAGDLAVRVGEEPSAGGADLAAGDCGSQRRSGGGADDLSALAFAAAHRPFQSKPDLSLVAAGGPGELVDPVPAATQRRAHATEWGGGRHGRVIGSRQDLSPQPPPLKGRGSQTCGDRSRV